MTYSSQCFSSYNPCSRDKQIKIVDGTLAIVAGQGKFSLTSALTLKCVLHVPKLSANLLVIHQITKYLNCTISFFHLIVLSRTKPHWGQLGMIRNRRVCTFLDVIICNSFFSEKFSLNKAQIWLHHLCLRHLLRERERRKTLILIDMFTYNWAIYIYKARSPNYHTCDLY